VMAPATDRLATVFERAPFLVERLRPVVAASDTPETVVARAREVIAVLSERERVAILQAHPRIGAPAGTLSALSRAEQGDDADPALLRELAELNENYERKFGFRFVVFVRGRSKREVAGVMRERLAQTRQRELATALEEFLAISLDRLRHAPVDGGATNARA
jgi:2-oxo-4-hydroxy-4-carboxy-5-ureidoimidazoline decarboxylase